MEAVSMEFQVFPENAKVCFDRAAASGLRFRPLLFRLCASIFRDFFCIVLFFVFWTPPLQKVMSAARAASPSMSLMKLIHKVHYVNARSAPVPLPTAYRVLSENPRPDSGKHAFSVIAGAGRSARQKREGFGQGPRQATGGRDLQAGLVVQFTW